MGLFTAFISRHTVSENALMKIFSLFSFAVVPAYFLSALWMNIPVWVYVLVVIAAFAQVIGWLWFVHLIRKNWNRLKPKISATSKYILACSAVALTAKLLLQLGSTIPSLSDLAFGFRPIVIGYLHLVLLGVISLFLLGSMFSEDYFYNNKKSVTGVFIFAGAVILNEIILMVQGVAAITYTSIPFINELLLGASILLFTGSLLMALTKINYFQKLFQSQFVIFYKRTFVKNYIMTNLAEQTLATIVTNNHFTVPVLEKYHLDFCCKGKRTLAEACIENGLPVETISGELEKIAASQQSSKMPFAEMTAAQLISYILIHQHFYVSNPCQL